MVHAIDMMVLPPHLSRKTQPLDVGIFRPLKRAMGSEIDRVTFLEPGQLPRGTWSELLTIAREKAFTKANISYGWRQAGLVPFNPYKVLAAAEETACQALPDKRTGTFPNSSMIPYRCLHVSSPRQLSTSVFHVSLHASSPRQSSTSLPPRQSSTSARI